MMVRKVSRQDEVPEIEDEMRPSTQPVYSDVDLLF